MQYKEFKDLRLSALGFGAMRLPVIDGDEARIDEEETARMVACAMQAGINYFDTAWGYHSENSETVMGRILKAYPRESFYLATKFPGYDPENLKRMEEIFSRQMEKGKQWVRLKDLELLDTPGTMPPAFDNQTLAKHLAYIGSMNDANIDFNDLAYELLGELKEKYPELIKKKYDIEDLSVPTLELYEKICVRRGFLRRGGEFDYERLATAIIDDFRKGRIGKIILD